MTAPLTDARLQAIEALAGSTYSGPDLDALRVHGEFCEAVRDLLTALAQCREEQEELAKACSFIADDRTEVIRENETITAALAAAREMLREVLDAGCSCTLSGVEAVAVDDVWGRARALLAGEGTK